MQPLSDTRLRLAYSFLLATGLIWGIALLGFLALLSGFFGNSPPWHYLGKFLLPSSWLWIGPLLLAAGAQFLETGFSEATAYRIAPLDEVAENNGDWFNARAMRDTLRRSNSFYLYVLRG